LRGPGTKDRPGCLSSMAPWYEKERRTDWLDVLMTILAGALYFIIPIALFLVV
jgi:hypothetical protein